MKKCPDCGQWTLEFDSYFGRFRCFNPVCRWMPPSSAQRQINLMRQHQQPRLVEEIHISELDMTLSCRYDETNDALAFDFGLEEMGFDFPESDGRLIWRIGRHTGSVVGFVICGARRFGVAEVYVDIAARKQKVERGIKAEGALTSGRPSKALIESIEVIARLEEPPLPPAYSKLTSACQEAIKRFESEFARQSS